MSTPSKRRGLRTTTTSRTYHSYSRRKPANRQLGRTFDGQRLDLAQDEVADTAPRGVAVLEHPLHEPVDLVTGLPRTGRNDRRAGGGTSLPGAGCGRRRRGGREQHADGQESGPKAPPPESDRHSAPLPSSHPHARRPVTAPAAFDRRAIPSDCDRSTAASAESALVRLGRNGPPFSPPAPPAGHGATRGSPRESGSTPPFSETPPGTRPALPKAAPFHGAGSQPIQ